MAPRSPRSVLLALGAALFLLLSGAVATASLASTRTTVAAAAPADPVEPRMARVVRVPAVVPVRPPAARPRPVKVIRPAAVRRTARVVVRPVAPVPPFGAVQAEERGRAAYASLGRRLPSGWVMRFDVYTSTWQGFADGGTKVVSIWVKASDTQDKLRITIAHEMGHVLDYTTLTAHDRGRYLALRGRSGTTVPWYPRNGTSDYASPAGDFAEVYALYRAGSGDFRSTFAPQPTSTQLSSLASFFADLEARQT